MAKKSRLVIAANRLPVNRVARGTGGGSGAVEWKRSPGGLVSAMEPLIERTGATWVGWDGGVGSGGAPRGFRAGKLVLAPVRLDRGEVDDYYRGFCNSTLWPLYHDAIQTPEFRKAWWGPYKEVNARFASAVCKVAGRDGIVWVHDYHLQLVPQMVRQERPDVRIGFFLHTPFPPEEIFAWLPWRSGILRGLLGADLCAFQTEASANNFSRMARRYTPAEGTDRELVLAGHRVRCVAIPISIDTGEFDRLAREESVQRRAEEIRGQLGGRKILLAVDRLDYTKGIETRLTAFHEMLKSRQVSADDVVLVQIAVPSREDALGYDLVRQETERLVGRINGNYSEPGKVAVHYFRRSLSREELVAYYLAADVMVVTPLRDGMNLVAKEYVASRVDHSGVLVLSEFAGAARELRRALLVNPRDVEAFASVMRQALRMPSKEMRMRMAVLRAQVKRHDVFEWGEQFLSALPK